MAQSRSGAGFSPGTPIARHAVPCNDSAPIGARFAPMKTLLSALLGGVLLCQPVALCQDGAVPLMGDAVRALGVDDQAFVQIAPGGPGYLVVWEEQRTVLGPFINAGNENLLGNQLDIYAARLDAAGNLLDEDPIVVCNLGRNQSKPQVAWDGSKWLVVFVSERPDWYFFRDIVGVRIAADGTVLDATPIPIRLEQNSPANYLGQTPSVLGRNGDWVVVWEDWNPANSFPNIKGTRVSDAGVVLDPAWPTLHEHNVAAFGPRGPRVVPLGNELLLSWLELNSGVRYRLISNTLAPLGPPTLIPSSPVNFNPSSASDGQTAMLLSTLKAWRVGVGGVLLDPAGITITSSVFNSESKPVVAWNGQSFSATYSISPAGTFFQPNDVFLVRISPAGQVLDAQPIAATSTGSDDRKAALAGVNGVTQFAYLVRNQAVQEDVRGVQVDAAGVAAVPVDVGTGLARQEYAQITTTDSAHVIVYASRRSDDSRVLMQRVAADGSAIDGEPLIVALAGENWLYRPDVAFDGQRILVVWNEPNQGVLARRYATDLTPLDAQPIQVFPAGFTPTVAGREGVFLIAATLLFSGDQNSLYGVRMLGDGTLLDPAPLFIGGGWVENPLLSAFGSGWLATWTRRPTHDSPSSAVRSRFVNLDGTLPVPDFQVSAGRAIDPDVAIAGDTALIVWCDDANINDERIEGRILLADGTLPGPELLICDQGNHQSFPAASNDGSQFVVTWVDYRSNGQIDQHRGDIYGGRVSHAGTVVDPLGVQITNGELPEDLPRMSTLHSSTRTFWLDLRGTGTTPHVQRIVQRDIGDLLPGAWQNLGHAKAGVAGEPALYGAGELLAFTPLSLSLDHAAPNAPAFLIVGVARADLPFLGGLLIPAPTIVTPLTIPSTGSFVLSTTWPALVPAGTTLYLQAWIQDAAATLGFAASNGLAMDS